jgi:anti-sigma B factor antagonist
VDFHWPKTKDAKVDDCAGILCQQDGALCQVSLAGRITIDSSPDLRLSLLQHLESPACQSLTVDLYEVAYIDTSGLAVLLEVLKAARDRGKTLYLSRLGERPRYLLEATRLLHLFKEAQ